MALPKINQPVTDDEIYEIQNAEKIRAGQTIQLFVPPVYDLALAGVADVFGTQPWVFRLPGVAGALLSLLVTFLLSRRLSPGRTGCFTAAAALLLAVNPAFVQGSLLVHIDNTILVPALLSWLYFLLRYCQSARGPNLLMAGVFLVLSLLIKFSTPLLMIPATVFFIAWKSNRRLSVKYLLSLFVSFAAFLVLWGMLAGAMQLSFLAPFSSAVSRTGLYADALKSNALLWIQNLCITGVWFSPYLLLLLIFQLPHIVSGISHDADKAGLLSLSLFTVPAYLLISTFNHGFPKYLMPGLPLLVVVCSYYTLNQDCRAKPVAITRGLVFVAALFFFYFLSLKFDPVYLLRYTVRDMLIHDDDRSNLMGIAAYSAVIWILPFIFYYGTRFVGRLTRSSLVPILSAAQLILLLALSHGMAISIVQSYGPYQTNYSYGERGTVELNEYLIKRLKPADRILATKDILYRLGRYHQYVGHRVWKEKETFLKNLKRNDTRFLVISIPSQSRTAYRTIFFSAEVQVLLKAYFKKEEIGTYEVFERVEE